MVKLTCDFDANGVIEITVFDRKVGQINRRTDLSSNGKDWYEVYHIPPEYPKEDRSLIAKAETAYECFFKFIKWYEFTYVLRTRKEAEPCTV